jgi:hypothetical protein
MNHLMILFIFGCENVECRDQATNDASETEIYKAMLDHTEDDDYISRLEKLEIVEHTLPLKEFAVSFEEEEATIYEEFEELQREVVDDFVSKNRISSELSPDIMINSHEEMIPQPCDEYSKCLDYLRLTRPGINKCRTQGVIYTEFNQNLEGVYGYYWFLQWQSIKWMVVENIGAWVKQ